MIKLASGIARLLLVLATILFLLSMGGGMAYAAPLLIPLHWTAARSARWGRLGWAILAFLSMAEASAIYSYVLFGEFSWWFGLVIATAFIVPFVLSIRSTQAGTHHLG